MKGERTHIVLPNTRGRRAFMGATLLVCGCNGILGIEELTYDGGETSHLDSGMDAQGTSDGGTDGTDGGAEFEGGPDVGADASDGSFTIDGPVPPPDAPDACVGCPIPIVANISPSDLALDEVNVYWINADKSIDSCPKTGCFSPQEIGSSNQPASLVTDGVDVYWSDLSVGEQSTTPGALYSCPVTGCPGAGPKTLEGQNGYAQAMATDGTRLYWYSANDTMLSCNTVDGGTPIQLASGEGDVSSIATDGTNVYWAGQTAGEGELALLKCAVSGCGGKPTTLLTFSNPESLDVSVATDGANVYFVAENEVEFCPVSGCVGGEPTVLAKDPDLSVGGGAIATDGVSVYWIETGVGTGGPTADIMKCAVGGCAMAPTQIATVSGPVVRGLALDKTRVYVATDNAILVAPK